MRGLLSFASTFALISLVTQTAAAQNLRLKDYAKHGFTSEADMRNYFTPADIDVQSSSASQPTEAESSTQVSDPEAKKSLSEGIANDLSEIAKNPADLSKWIVLGAKVFAVVLQNKPVVNVSTQRISVLPVSQQNWAEMDGWHSPASKVNRVIIKNLYGLKVIKFTYTVSYNYGGRYQGRGSYLANATVIPSRVSVAWGYSLNSNVQVGDVVNTGKDGNAVPGVDLRVNYAVDTFLKHEEWTDSHFITGDGKIRTVTEQN